jgi:integrase
MLELMARGGMRISEVLGLKPGDIDDQKLLLHSPKSGREQEVEFIPKKLSKRLLDYVRAKDYSTGSKNFPDHLCRGKKGGGKNWRNGRD